VKRARGLTRRSLLVMGGSTAAALSLPRGAVAAEEKETHGISAFGDLKYPANFSRFDYVNPQAPKGGTFSHIGSSRAYNQSFLTFNSLNSFVLRGDAAQGMELTFAVLMVRALDEPDAMYGLAARGVRISADGLTYRFLIRPDAKFHDGTKLTAQDAAFSFNTLKEKGHPIIHQLMRDVVEVVADDDMTLAVKFSPKHGREIPLFVASLPIFSRAYYATKNFEDSTLDVPLGSGPYRVGRFEAGRFIEYERVKDWWGADLPVARGQNNFDTVRYEYYRDRDVAFEGFTARNYLFREEFTSRIWATRYDFPAMRDGRVKREVLPDLTPSGAQGWFINTRREKFKDPRVREAIGLAFDFEWTNKNVMYGAYDRTQSYFENSDMKAEGKPSPEELVLLEPFRGKIPEEAFGEPFVPPVSDGSGQDRALLRRAGALLQAAGYEIKDNRRINARGETISIEFLIEEPALQPHHAPFIKNLAILGIGASVRLVDPVQYKAREDEFDFDITIQRFSFSSTPGESLRSYFTAQSAATKGTQNLSGIADPVVDALVEKVIEAKSRAELTTACRALDRVLRAGRYWVPHWYKPSHWLAYWDVFARPTDKPRFGRGFPETWWSDPAKAGRAG
jgi:microcin C transport system substrate-binding protein